MTKGLLFITTLITLVNGMVSFDAQSHLDNLLQKLPRYLHHRENYILSSCEQVVPTGLKLKKKLANNYISDRFEQKRINIFYDTEKQLAELLLNEKEKLLMSLKKELNDVTINSYDSDFEKKRDGLYKMHIEFQQVEKGRQRK